MADSGSFSHRNLGLDVIRATAILLVLVSHFGDIFARFCGAVSPGYVSISGVFGVELFFVLSGFLIGNLLLRIVRTEPSWRSWLVFMIRRWMRTLPLYFVWMGVLLLIWPPLDHTWSHIAHYATLTQNLLWRMPHDKWFGVSWSLAVEEWFYLLFSAALIGSVAVTGTRKCVWYVIALFIAAPVAARLGLPATGDWSQTTYETVGLRLDAIAYGVVLAKLGDRDASLFRHPWLALGVGLATLAFVWAQASVQPLPTSLGGVTLTVQDSAGVHRPAPLIYVSSSQINLVVPAGTSSGQATFTVSNGTTSVSATATETLDLTGVHRTLQSWRRIAWLTTANGPAGYRRMLARADRTLRTGELPRDSVPLDQVKALLTERLG